jgi:hypothetical protein
MLRVRQVGANGDPRCAAFEAADASLTPCNIACALEPPVDTVSANDIAPVSATATPFAAPVCRRCAHRLLPHVRLGYLRVNSVRQGGAHDHPS